MGDKEKFSPRVVEILHELADLHKRKAADYGSLDDPFLNYRLGAQLLGVPGWHSAAMRLSEKFARLSTLVKHGALTNEGADELLSDIALIAVITLVLYEDAVAQAREEGLN